MPLSNFKNIVGSVATGQPANIRFFGKITEESASQFNSEFDYLESIVRPSLIRVLINSEGGSVLHGMSVYSTIQNSGIATECVNEGMAASMGSIIWAAGNRSLMRDYAILMIHNPFIPSVEDDKGNDLVLAFTNQIKTIYRKRFGLSNKHITAIMEGDAGKDGTFFDSEGAIRAGIILPDNILVTSEQIRQKVKVEMSGIEDISEIQDIMTRICAQVNHTEPQNKPSREELPNISQTHNNQTQMSEVINKTTEYSAVAGSLGFSEKSEVKDVIARVSELLLVESKLKQTEKELTDAQTVIDGKDATISNLEKEMGDVKALLTTFQAKEEEAARAERAAIIQDAVNKGKIKNDPKVIEKWNQRVEKDPEMVKEVLNDIYAPEQISKEIASDPENVKAAVDSKKSTEDEMAEKVAEVVGDGFKFGTLK